MALVGGGTCVARAKAPQLERGGAAVGQILWRRLSKPDFSTAVNSSAEGRMAPAPRAREASSTASGVASARGAYLGFDHVHLWVGNAHQAAGYYVARFGFEPLAFRGLETGSREVMTHVVRLGRVVFAFSSSLVPGNSAFAEHLARHGDSVRDVEFRVSDCRAVYDRAVERGAVPVSPPEVLK